MNPFASLLPAALPDERTAVLRQDLLTDRTGTLTRLYRRTFPAVRRLVQQQGGTAQDAEDVFQDALIVLYEKAVAGTLQLTAAPGTYLVAVSRNLWRQELQRRGRAPLTDLTAEHAEQLPGPADANEEAARPVLDYLARLGQKCQSILLDFYYFQQPLSQIAAAHRYGSVRSATVQKFKCLERLRHAVREAWAETADAATY